MVREVSRVMCGALSSRLVTEKEMQPRVLVVGNKAEPENHGERGLFFLFRSTETITT